MWDALFVDLFSALFLLSVEGAKEIQNKMTDVVLTGALGSAIV